MIRPLLLILLPSRCLHRGYCIIFGEEMQHIMVNVAFILLHKPLHNIRVCFLFLRVVQLLQGSCDAAPLERIFQEIVTDMGILRKQRAVQIGADHCV